MESPYKIYPLREQEIMLDFDLAALYGVETRVLNQAVKRNLNRFPFDFMFKLASDEWANMSSQFVMTYPDKRPKKSPPYAFTEQGIAMLSSVLRSERAIQVNIAIMRTFVYVRRQAVTHQELQKRLALLEDRFDNVFEAINYLIQKDEQEHNQQNRSLIGYKLNQ